MTIVYGIIFHDWLCHLATFLYQNYYKGGQVTKLIVKNDAINYCKELNVFDNFLASADIKALLPACMLLLIGVYHIYVYM